MESDKTTIINNDDDVCQQQQQQQQVAMKITLVPTEENRLVLLPRLSFAHLTDKIRAIFSTDDFSVHYIDDEGDRVTVSLDDELACAVACVGGAKPLRLYVTPTAATTIVSPTAPKVGEAITIKSEATPSEEEEEQETEAEVNQAAAPETKEKEQEEAKFEALLAKLEEKGLGGGSCKADRRRNLRLLTKFAGDMDKVEAAVLRRRECRAGKKEKRQHAKGHKQGLTTAAEAPTESSSIDVEESLLAQLEEKGFGGNEGKRRRNERLLKRFSDDVDQVIAFLEARKLKCQEAGMKRQSAPAAASSTGTDSSDCVRQAEESLLAQLEEKGFGGDEGKRRRNERLLKRFSGDIDQVVAFLEARKLKCQQARKNTPATTPPCALTESQVECLLAELDEKGFGGNEVKRRRNARLLRCFSGDVARVEAVLTARRNKMITDIGAEYEPLLAQLEDKGFGGGDFERKRNVRLIKRFAGDMTRVEALLERRKAVKADNAQLEPLLGQLEAKGLGGGGEERMRRRNMRLLRKFKGDVGQVEAWLLTKRQRCEARQQQRRAKNTTASSEVESAC